MKTERACKPDDTPRPEDKSNGKTDTTTHKGSHSVNIERLAMFMCTLNCILTKISETIQALDGWLDGTRNWICLLNSATMASQQEQVCRISCCSQTYLSSCSEQVGWEDVEACWIKACCAEDGSRARNQDDAD